MKLEILSQPNRVQTYPDQQINKNYEYDIL